jgi:hypothetical protein
MSTTPIERVRKLIALTASPNEHEARNAAALACRIIRESNGAIVLAAGAAPPTPAARPAPPPAPPPAYYQASVEATTPGDAFRDFMRDLDERMRAAAGVPRTPEPPPDDPFEWRVRPDFKTSVNFGAAFRPTSGPRMERVPCKSCGRMKKSGMICEGCVSDARRSHAHVDSPVDCRACGQAFPLDTIIYGDEGGERIRCKCGHVQPWGKRPAAPRAESAGRGCLACGRYTEVPDAAHSWTCGHCGRTSEVAGRVWASKPPVTPGPTIDLRPRGRRWTAEERAAIKAGLASGKLTIVHTVLTTAPKWGRCEKCGEEIEAGARVAVPDEISVGWAVHDIRGVMVHADCRKSWYEAKREVSR